jgi:7-cyano-7-deazaguanine reductase
METWNFTKKIEDMTADELKARVEQGYNAVMPTIQVIPYVGTKSAIVKYIYAELTALCPMTGIQDLYTLTIEFNPDSFVPELKSLKFYLLAYKDLPISHEHLASKIEKEFCEVVKPANISLNLDTAIRGGIKTIIDI